MKKISKNLIVIGIFVALLLGPFLASAAESPGRYFIKSESSFWRNAFGVRHAFGDGFTSDLADWQVRFGKFFGLEVKPVVSLFILPQENSDTTPQKNTPPQKKQSKPPFRYLPSDQTPWGIEMVYRDNFIQKTSGGNDVNVAIIDTGILTTHPDLGGRIKECKDFTGRKNPIVDGKCDDKNGHGTHVAGIIAADGGADGLGVYGVAPETNLFAYRVCSSSGFCYADDIAMAIKEATDNGANIINISLGSDNYSPLIFEGIEYAVTRGLLVVAAAGNDGPYFDSLDYPAASKEVVGIGAFDVFINIAEWSSRGKNSATESYVKEDRDIEFAMPGVNIESTWRDGGYAILSGTSMASPFLTGLASKYWQFTSENPAESTRAFLRNSVDDIHLIGDDDASGWGFPRVFTE